MIPDHLVPQDVLKGQCKAGRLCAERFGVCLGQSEFIADFVTFVQDAKKAGKTVDDVATTWTTPAKYVGYGAPQAARVKADAEVIWAETK